MRIPTVGWEWKLAIQRQCKTCPTQSEVCFGPWSSGKFKNLLSKSKYILSKQFIDHNFSIKFQIFAKVTFFKGTYIFRGKQRHSISISCMFITCTYILGRRWRQCYHRIWSTSRTWKCDLGDKRRAEICEGKHSQPTSI